MKLSEKSRMIIHFIATFEQWALLVGTVYLVGWKGWSAWWFFLTIILIASSAPSTIIQVLEKEKP